MAPGHRGLRPGQLQSTRVLRPPPWSGQAPTAGRRIRAPWSSEGDRGPQRGQESMRQKPRACALGAGGGGPVGGANGRLPLRKRPGSPQPPRSPRHGDAVRPAGNAAHVCLQTCACPGSARASGPSGITLPSPGPHRCPEACAQAHLWVQALGPPGRAEGTCGPWIRGKAERPAAAPPPLLGGPVGLQGGRCPQTRPWPGQRTWARVCGEAAESVHVGVWQGLAAWLAVGAGRRLVEGRAAGGKASGPSQCSAETPPHAGTRTTRQPGDVYRHHPGTRTAGRQ